MKITLQNLAKRLTKIEKHLELTKEQQSDKRLQTEVLRLDWKHHGWTGTPNELGEDRDEWEEAAETIKLIRNWGKEK